VLLPEDGVLPPKRVGEGTVIILFIIIIIIIIIIIFNGTTAQRGL
jgi:hypothetical protein